jgi:hypothetical protein
LGGDSFRVYFQAADVGVAMKILHVCQSDTVGGASRAAYRLHKGLQCIEVDSQCWCSQNSDDQTVLALKAKLEGDRQNAHIDALSLDRISNEALTFIHPHGFHSEIL